MENWFDADFSKTINGNPVNYDEHSLWTGFAQVNEINNLDNPHSVGNLDNLNSPNMNNVNHINNVNNFNFNFDTLSEFSPVTFLNDVPIDSIHPRLEVNSTNATNAGKTDNSAVLISHQSAVNPMDTTNGSDPAETKHYEPSIKLESDPNGESLNSKSLSEKLQLVLDRWRNVPWVTHDFSMQDVTDLIYWLQTNRLSS